MSRRNTGAVDLTDTDLARNLAFLARHRSFIDQFQTLSAGDQSLVIDLTRHLSTMTERRERPVDVSLHGVTPPTSAAARAFPYRVPRQTTDHEP